MHNHHTVDNSCGAPPYGHLGNTVTSLPPLLFELASRQNDIHTVSCKETLVNMVTSLLRPNCFGPLVTVLTGFHCTTKQHKLEVREVGYI